MSGGAPLPIEVRSRFEQLTGCHLVEGYGLSEASPVVTCNPLAAVKTGSIGVPLPGTKVEIRLPHDPTKILPQGEKGEICVRGPQVMAGYWQKPGETDMVFIDGALRTGDIGYVDEEGYIFLVDRIKDVIISGGFNIYPRVIEEALYQHPAVAETVVIAVPDPYRGQAPKAFVRLRDGQKATPEELREFLAGYVSRIELPKLIEIRDVLPKTMVGKLSKKELIAEEEAKAAAGNSLEAAS
jgi:long-chain acyl-CoA synthetase